MERITDTIGIHGLTCYGRHGVLPEEAVIGQRFIADVTLVLDLREAGERDELEATVNYADVAGLVTSILQGPPMKLIETVAHRIASEVLAAYTSIIEITVRITKPNPPIHAFFDGVSVQITRRRQDR